MNLSSPLLIRRWTNVSLVGLTACAAACAAPLASKTTTSPPPEGAIMKDESVATAERLVADMDAAFARQDLEALAALFAEDATLESFLVSRVLKKPDGVCHGKAEIREVLRGLVEHGVPWGGHEPPLVRGNRVAVEFKTASSDQDTFSVDILEIADGKIRSLRAYAGWRALAAGRTSAPK